MLNTQSQARTVPVGATVRVHLPEGFKAKRVVLLPAQGEMAFRSAGPYVQFRVEPFKALAMVLVEFE
jgi:hypothetical protein